VTWEDQTEENTAADLLTKELVTDSIDEVVKELGGLSIRDWDRSGLGDIAVVAKFYRDFPQEKEHLKNVRITAHAGVTIPTSEQRNEDEAFSFSLGNDGAWGIPLGLALDLDFSDYVRAGVEGYFLALLDETRIRRMKTDEHQTDFLLLHKGRSARSFGPMWRFLFYAQFSGLIEGLSATTAYHFTKHDNDTLIPQTDEFLHGVVNSAESLREWAIHNFLFQLNFDAGVAHKNWWIKPHVSLFYKLPLIGKRSISTSTFGAQIGLSF